MPQHSTRLLVSLAFALAVLSRATPGFSQDVASPPDHARLVGSVAEVPFRWGGHAKAHRIEVFAQGKSAYAQPVNGNSVTLRLVPGPMYQWRVQAYEGGRFVDVVPLRSFQFSNELEFHFDGPRGGNGSGYGAPGGNGGDGQSVSITLAGDLDYIRLRVSGNISGPDTLLLRSSAPVTVTAAGGDGGSGAPGIPGEAGSVRQVYDTAGRVYYQAYPPGPGGPGGSGGHGGNGGQVTVVASGVEWTRYLRVRLPGGRPGAGGPGGAGGVPANASYNGYSVTGSYAPGPPGPDGPSGRQGQDGSVIAPR